MMAMMGDPYDECDTSMILEPTPLSEIVHQQHVLNQQQQQQQQRIQEQHLYLDENSDDFVFRSSKRRRGQPLRVSFYSEAMVHSSPRRIDEIPSMWYSKEELATFKTDRKVIVRALKKVNFDLSRIDRNEYCLRGLEPYLSISFNKRMQQKRTQVMHDVMTEQARQRSLQQNDVERLRGGCCYATEWARKRAHELGINDSRELGFPVVLEACSSWGQDSNLSQTHSLCTSFSGSSSSVVSISPTITTERKHLPLQTTASPGPMVKPCQPAQIPPTAATATPASMSCAQQFNQQQHQYIHTTATATPEMNSSWSPFKFVQPTVLAATTATTYPSAAAQPGNIALSRERATSRQLFETPPFPDQC